MIPLSRKKTLELHQNLWFWLAKETRRQCRKVDKAEYFKQFGLEAPLNDCYCCEYSESMSIYNNGEKPWCSYCPLVWGSTKKAVCTSKNSLYTLWQRCEENDWEKAAEYAYQIAKLPVKPADD